MVNYDPNIIQEFAERMYRKANFIIRLFAVVGVLVCSGTGIGIHGVSAFVIGYAAIGGFIGYLIGKEIAFWFKFRAQEALCQGYIEAGIRKMTAQVPGGGQVSQTPRKVG